MRQINDKVFETSKENPNAYNLAYAWCSIPESVGGIIYPLTYEGNVYNVCQIHNPFASKFKKSPLVGLKSTLTGTFRFHNKQFTNLRVLLDPNFKDKFLCEIETNLFTEISSEVILHAISRQEHVFHNGNIVLTGKYTFVKTSDNVFLCNMKDPLYIESKKNTDGLKNKKPIDSLKVGGVYVTPRGNLCLLLGFASTLFYSGNSKPKKHICMTEMKQDIAHYGYGPIKYNRSVGKIEKLQKEFEFNAVKTEYNTVWLSCPNTVSMSKLRGEYDLLHFIKDPSGQVIVGKRNTPVELFASTLDDIKINMMTEVYNIRKISTNNVLKRIENIEKNCPQYLRTYSFAKFLETQSPYFNIVPFGMDPYVDYELDEIIQERINIPIIKTT